MKLQIKKFKYLSIILFLVFTLTFFPSIPVHNRQELETMPREGAFGLREAPAQWADFTFSPYGSGIDTGNLVLDGVDLMSVRSGSYLSSETYKGYIKPGIQGSESNADILTQWNNADNPPHWNKLDEAKGDMNGDGGNIRENVVGQCDKWRFTSLTLAPNEYVTKLKYWSYIKEQESTTSTYVDIDTSASTSGSWSASGTSYQWKSYTKSGLSLSQSQLDGFWLQAKVADVYPWMEWYDPGWVDIETVYVDVYTKATYYKHDWTVTWDVSDADLSLITALHYEYRATSDVTTTMKIYNYDTPTWEILESNTGTNWITDRFAINSTYLSANDEVKLHFSTTATTTGAFDLQFDQLYLTYSTEPSDYSNTICRPNGDISLQWLPSAVPHWNRLVESGDGGYIAAGCYDTGKIDEFMMDNSVKFVGNVTQIQVKSYGYGITSRPSVSVFWNGKWQSYKTVNVPLASLPPITPGWATTTFNLEGDQKDVEDLRVRYKAGGLYYPYSTNYIDAFYCNITYTQGITLMSPRPNENYTEYVMLDISPDTLTQVEYNLNSGGWQSISGDTALYIPEGEDHSIQVRGYYDTTQYYSNTVNFNTWNVSTSGEQGLDWGADQIGAESCWDYITGDNIKVLVIDTGMDLDHDDLVDNYEEGMNFIFLEAGNPPEDDNGHGTNCAGIIGAIDNDIGVIGVSPEVSLYIARVLPSDNDDIYDAIYWGITEGVDVISMSIGGPADSDILSIITTAYNNGITFIACAGNWMSEDNPLTGWDETQTGIQYPAAYYDYVIPVGALYYDLTLAGSTTNNRWYPDPEDPDYYGGSCYGYDEGYGIVAPGTQITSTDLDNDYYTGNGTSYATPLVAGVCALILAASSEIYQMTGRTRVEAVRECIYNTAIDLGASGWDQYYGNGMVDATRAINYALANFY